MNMLDQSCVGRHLGQVKSVVEKGRLRFFAKAIGEENPIYTDERAAMDAGFRSLPVPPSYFLCLQMLDDPDPTAWIQDLGVDLKFILHAEQSFEFIEPAVACDQLTFDSRIAELYEKKGGALQFLVTESTGTNQFGRVVVMMKCTTVLRKPGAITR